MKIKNLKINDGSVTVKGDKIIIDLRDFEQFTPYGMGGRGITTLLEMNIGNVNYEIEFREKTDFIRIIKKDSGEEIDLDDFIEKNGIEIDTFNSKVDEMSKKFKISEEEIRSMLFYAANN